MVPIRACFINVLATLLAITALPVGGAHAGTGDLSINVVSSRADMVSEGSALVTVSVPVGVPASTIKVTINDVDATAKFLLDGEKLIGLVDGMAIGRNLLAASYGTRIKKLILVNNHRDGPIISGPHQMPFICQTETFRLPDGTTLGKALDANCNIPTQVQYYYRPAGGGNFRLLDPGGALPADMAQTVTSDGIRVNYIVRLETGTVNRAIYQLAVLHDPVNDPAPSPSARYRGWNRKIVYPFGGSAAAGYQQGYFAGMNSGILFDGEYMLARGFAVISSSLNVLGHASSDVLSAETASLVREKFIKTFGVPVYTMGWGGSGGSMSQQLIANNYPGLLDGITPAGSFPDLHSLVAPAVDCSLLERAFDGSKQSWSEAQKTAVSGYGTWDVCNSWKIYSPWWVRPTQSNNPAPIAPGGMRVDVNNCPMVLPREQIYDPKTNPGGARCDIYSGIRNLIGTDPVTGFALRGFDNIGVQYGLKAYLAGAITGEQFVALNEGVGGYDNDGNFQPQRTRADPIALNRLYAYGRINSGINLGAIPIIDHRSDPGLEANVHDSVRSFIMRARLMRAHGSIANHVIIRHKAMPTFTGSGQASNWDEMNIHVLMAMDKWLSAIKRDTKSYPSEAARVIANRPVELTDQCYPAKDRRIDEFAGLDNSGACAKQMPIHADPRLAAGAPLTDDILKCQLKPISPASYPNLTIDQIARLRKVFPTGVCDWSKPGIGMKSLKATWLSYPSPGVAVPLRRPGD